MQGFVGTRWTWILWQFCEGMERCWHFTTRCMLPSCFKDIPATLSATRVPSCSCTRARSYRLTQSLRPGKPTSFFPFRAENRKVTTILQLLLRRLLSVKLAFRNRKTVELWSSLYPTSCLPRSFQAPPWEKIAYPNLVSGGGTRKGRRCWSGWNRGSRACSPLLKWQPNDLLIADIAKICCDAWGGWINRSKKTKRLLGNRHHVNTGLLLLRSSTRHLESKEGHLSSRDLQEFNLSSRQVFVQCPKLIL